MKNELKIIACRFKRTRKSEWENGIAVEKNNINIILDKNAKPVKAVWDFDLDWSKLSVTVTL